MTRKDAPTQRERRARYTPNQAFTNAFAARVCGIKAITEQDWIEADLAANVDKPEKANQRDEAAALVEQIDYLNKIGCDL